MDAAHTTSKRIYPSWPGRDICGHYSLRNFLGVPHRMANIGRFPQTKLKLEIELENPSPKVSACPYVRTRAGSLVPRLSLFVSSFRRQTTQLGQSLELRKLTILEVLAGLGLITVLKSSSIRILYYSNARQRHF